MSEKPKATPRNPVVIAVRIVRLIILLSALPLYFAAQMMADAYNRPGFFIGLVLFLVVYVLIAFFAHVGEITPFELIGNVARFLWQVTSLDKDKDDE